MLDRSIRLVIVFLAMGLLQGCFMMKQNFTRDTLKNEGLVVAEVLRLNNDGNIHTIDGKPAFNSGSFPQGISEGLMVVSLPPGKHILQSVTSVSGSLTTTYYFNLEFEIRAGFVTNLGKVILLMDQKHGSKKYRILSVEYNQYMLNYLRKSYPDAFGSIGNQLIKPKFRQLAAKDMKSIRVEVARRKMIIGQNTLQLNRRDYMVYGGLGTLVKFSMSKDLKKFDRVKALKTNTLDALLSCDVYKSTVACLSHSETNAKVLIVNGNNVVSRKLSSNNKFSKLFFERNGSIVLVNNQYTFMRSNDLGKSWSLDKRFYHEQGASYVLDMAQGLDGFFLYQKKQDAPVLQYHGKTGQFSKLEIPFDEDYLTNIVETRNGIYIGPEFTLMSNARLFYKKNSKSQWQEIEVPYSGCTGLKSLDRGAGKYLQMQCEYGTRVESKDGGKSWHSAS